MAAKQSFDLAAARRIMATPAVQSRCHEVLERALSNNIDIDMMSISSVDGRPFACSQRIGVQASRVAALSATLMSVSESLAKEVDGDRVDYATLSLRNGVVISKRIPDLTGVFTLSLFSRGTTNLALALRTTIDMASHLAAEINAQVQLEPQPA